MVKITHTVAGGRGTSLGSGTIIDARGYILTNAHVAAGATSYDVTLADNRTVKGKLTGLDPLDDLAVIQVDVPNLPVAELGDSSKLEVAQTVLAIGNPIGFTRTVTQGIVSALDRTITQPPNPATGQGGISIPNMIQISAPINPGNSGGALIDLAGRLVGVPTLAAAVPELGSAAQGIGFAVPINTAKFIVPQLISQGKVTSSGRAYLGVVTQTVDPSLARAYRLPASTGAFVAQVSPGSPAAQAGLKQGDIITSFDGQQVQTSQELGELILHKNDADRHPPGGAGQSAVDAISGRPPDAGHDERYRQDHRQQRQVDLFRRHVLPPREPLPTAILGRRPRWPAWLRFVQGRLVLGDVARPGGHRRLHHLNTSVCVFNGSIASKHDHRVNTL